MQEYRRDIELDRDKDYHWVRLGPIPDLPGWHLQSQETQYPFPTENAAFRFAEGAKAAEPRRRVMVVTADGERFELS